MRVIMSDEIKALNKDVLRKLINGNTKQESIQSLISELVRLNKKAYDSTNEFISIQTSISDTLDALNDLARLNQ